MGAGQTTGQTKGAAGGSQSSNDARRAEIEAKAAEYKFGLPLLQIITNYPGVVIHGEGKSVQAAVALARQVVEALGCTWRTTAIGSVGALAKVVCAYDVDESGLKHMASLSYGLIGNSTRESVVFAIVNALVATGDWKLVANGTTRGGNNKRNTYTLQKVSKN